MFIKSHMIAMQTEVIIIAIILSIPFALVIFRSAIRWAIKEDMDKINSKLDKLDK